MRALPRRSDWISGHYSVNAFLQSLIIFFSRVHLLRANNNNLQQTITGVNLYKDAKCLGTLLKGDTIQQFLALRQLMSSVFLRY